MNDQKDLQILNILLKDSRLSAREIAKKVKLSTVSVLKRMKVLKDSNVIKSFSCNLDYEKLGYDVQAIIDTRISKGRLFEVEEKIAHLPGVIAVYDVTGDFDALIIARFKSRRKLDAFLKKIQKFNFVERTQTRFVLNTIREEQNAVE